MTIKKSAKITVHDLVADFATEILTESQEEGAVRRLSEEFFSRTDHAVIRSGEPVIEYDLARVHSIVLESDTRLRSSSRQDPQPSLCRFLQANGGGIDSFQPLARLRCLRLQACPFESLPEGMENMRLRVLEIRDCRALLTLPESLCQSTGLTSLVVWGCGALQGLPESLGQCTGLTLLDLSGCSALKQLPESVGSLSGIEVLNLTRCEKLVGHLGSLGNLTRLKDLVAVGCESLTSLPESIGQLTGIMKLCLALCHPLKELPEGITQLLRLKDLNCTAAIR